MKCLQLLWPVLSKQSSFFISLIWRVINLYRKLYLPDIITCFLQALTSVLYYVLTHWWSIWQLNTESTKNYPIQERSYNDWSGFILFHSIRLMTDQKCSQVLLVTRFPVQLWDISWAMTYSQTDEISTMRKRHTNTHKKHSPYMYWYSIVQCKIITHTSLMDHHTKMVTYSSKGPVSSLVINTRTDSKTGCRVKYRHTI